MKNRIGRVEKNRAITNRSSFDHGFIKTSASRFGYAAGE
jgi:hypothetical protein